MSILVIKPSTNIPNEPQFSDIISSKVARGFFASKKSADQCSTIFVTDGLAYKAAEITNVTEKLIPPNGALAEQWIKRIDVTFDHVRDLISAEYNKVNMISWSSRNVRFI